METSLHLITSKNFFETNFNLLFLPKQGGNMSFSFSIERNETSTEDEKMEIIRDGHGYKTNIIRTEDDQLKNTVCMNCYEYFRSKTSLC